jgi:hypothetical protein
MSAVTTDPNNGSPTLTVELEEVVLAGVVATTVPADWRIAITAAISAGEKSPTLWRLGDGPLDPFSLSAIIDPFVGRLVGGEGEVIQKIKY